MVEIKPFTPKRVAVVTTEGLGEKVWDRFRSAVSKKIGWYGSTVTGFTDLIDDPITSPAIEGRSLPART